MFPEPSVQKSFPVDTRCRVRTSCGPAARLVLSGLETNSVKEKENEHLDNSVRHSADCLDYRLQRVSRCGWIHPPAADLCCNLFDFAFRNGSKRSLTQAPKCPWLEKDGGDCNHGHRYPKFEAIPPEPLCFLPKLFNSGANCKYRIQLHAYSHISSFPFWTILLIGNPPLPR